MSGYIKYNKMSTIDIKHVWRSLRHSNFGFLYLNCLNMYQHVIRVNISCICWDVTKCEEKTKQNKRSGKNSFSLLKCKQRIFLPVRCSFQEIILCSIKYKKKMLFEIFMFVRELAIEMRAVNKIVENIFLLS